MTTVVRRAIVVVLLVLSAACGRSGPVAPTSPALPAAPPVTPPTPTNLPPLAGPSRIFTFDHELKYSVRNYTKTSRFVFYDDGAFVLQYPGIGDYRGSYTQSNAVLQLYWEGWSVAGSWGATATLSGDVLTVQYNQIMELSDFENAVYVLTP